MSAINNQRIVFFDSIRGLAALMVMFHHYTKRYDSLFGHIVEWPIMSSYDLGAWGVNIFFILTGIFLIPSLISSDSIWYYFKKRAIRLYSSYVPCVVITMLLMTFAPPLGDRNVSFLQFLVNLTMFQTFLGVPNVDGAYWTLSVQLIFWCVVAVAFFVSKKRVGVTLNTLFVWLMVGAALWGLKQVGHPHFLFITDAKYIGLFVQGVSLWCLSNKQCVFWKGFLLLVVSSFYCLLWFSLPFLVFNILVILVLWFIMTNSLRLKRRGILAFIGAISFPLYLLHQNLGYIIIRFFEAKGLTSEIYVLIPMIIAPFRD